MARKRTASDLTFRLPKGVKPLHYDLFLHPDLAMGTFQGTVKITIDVTDERNYVALHQALHITAASLKTCNNVESYDSGSDVPIKDFYSINELQKFVVEFDKDLPAGLYNLSIEFKGALWPDEIFVGFYSSTYKDVNNKKRYIAISKFEPTFARRAFPCFDEPDFKAQFSVRLVHPTGDDYGALSSMNVENTEVDKPGSGLTTVTFAKSVPMSTYLICFIVSDFTGVYALAKNLEGKKFPITVYTTKAQKEKAVFALDIGVKIIEYYMKLFKINYPLPKLDMAAIPDFASGAMENWGIVTYSEATFLYDKSTSSTSDKNDIVVIISHEFAHMWFGNLVTMAWWNDLWLNEGFAIFMQYKSANEILPDCGFMENFLLDAVHPVLGTDSKLSSHPIVQTVNDDDEIAALFDTITYYKGASVLRMLENFVSPDIFYAGVTAYLNKFAYQNAETADFLGTLQNAITNNINITSIMDTWTRQTGYPVVKAVKNGLHYILTQKRFLADPDAIFDPAESNYGYKWTIPITYVTDKNTSPTLIWFDKDATKLEVKLDEPVEWIKFNHNQVGYYRVNYAVEEWENLLSVLQSHHEKFSVPDRTHLLEDAFSLAHASELEYSVVMNMTRYLRLEKSSIPWSVTASKLTSIDQLLASTDVVPKYREYVRNLVDSTYHNVTWKVRDLEDHNMINLRRSVLELACAVGHEKCLDEAGTIFKAWIRDRNDIRPPPDIRSLVYYYGMSHVGEGVEWNIMFQRFVNETNAAEKVKLMIGLAGVDSSSILKKYIAMATDEKYVRVQDLFSCLTAISRNSVGTPLVWDWVRENWVFLISRHDLIDLGFLITAITKSFATELKLKEMQAFFEKYPIAGPGKTIRETALETVANNIKWVKTNSKKVENWLDSKSTTQ